MDCHGQVVIQVAEAQRLARYFQSNKGNRL